MLSCGGKQENTITQKLNDGAKVLLFAGNNLLQTFYKTFYSNLISIPINCVYLVVFQLLSCCY